MCISRSLCGIVISAHGNGKDKTETMFSLRFQFIHCLQGMYTITCGSVNINHQTHIRTLYMHTSFISARAYNFAAGCMLACLHACYHSALKISVLLPSTPSGAIRLCSAVGRIPDRPGALVSDIRHTLTSRDITETFHRANPVP